MLLLGVRALPDGTRGVAQVVNGTAWRQPFVEHAAAMVLRTDAAMAAKMGTRRPRELTKAGSKTAEETAVLLLPGTVSADPAVHPPKGDGTMTDTADELTAQLVRCQAVPAFAG